MKLFLTKSFTGLSDYENKGVAGRFKFGQNLDVRKDTDSLSCGQALTDDLSPTIEDNPMTSLALFVVNASDGNSYHFCRGGKIYKRSSAGTYTLVYTDADGVITGASEWVNDQGNKFLYWANSTKLKRKQIPGSSDWSDVNATVNGQTYPKTNLTSAVWHTMLQMSGSLYICNANTLGLVGYDDSYTNDALQLIPGNNSKCLMEYNNYAYIGCSRDDNGQRAELFVWDMAQSLNWNAVRKQGASPVNALISAEFPLAQVGPNGNIRLSDVSQYTLPIKSFPGGGQVNPDGVEADDLAYFGSFGNTPDTNTTDFDGQIRTGVYTFGRKKHNADPVTNLEYALDCDEIGYVKYVGTDLLISYYKEGVGYGVKKVDQSTKANGLYQSLDFRAPNSIKEPVWSMVKVVMKSLPAQCYITVRRRINKTGEWKNCNLVDKNTSADTEGTIEAFYLMGDKGRFCEVEIALHSYGDTCPEIFYFETIFE